MCKCTDLAQKAHTMTKDEAYDQMREAGARLKLASRGMKRGDPVERWQSIIDAGLDMWLEARGRLREAELHPNND